MKRAEPPLRAQLQTQLAQMQHRIARELGRARTAGETIGGERFAPREDLPLLIDSPGWSPLFKGKTLEVRVPFDDISIVNAAGFDGVTAALRVNASVHSPLLCVANVFKVGSGDLSLPGKVNQ